MAAGIGFLFTVILLVLLAQNEAHPFNWIMPVALLAVDCSFAICNRIFEVLGKGNVILV
jgi:hypothetical protein